MNGTSRLALLAVAATALHAQTERHGSLATQYITSQALANTRTGLDPKRSVIVYLPPGYSESGRRYPVIYYFHSLFTSNTHVFADGRVQQTLDRAISTGVTREVILVAADYSTPTPGCFFENSSTTGRWMDFTVEELVPFIDGHFRTLAKRESRGLAGDFMGGYGALKFAMLYPGLFSVVYALHPVGTGTGLVPMASRPDWRKIHEARSFRDLDGDVFAQVFTAMAQAFLPNPQRPPFYCDFMMEPDNGELKQNAANTVKLQDAFLLDHMLSEKADNLRKMRAIRFDWARYDSNQDHVFANEAFTRRLDELGIDHEAEEYNAVPGVKNWTLDGRVATEMLPFFGRYLTFE